MGYGKLAADISAFDELAGQIGFVYPRNAPVAAQMAMVKEFLSDIEKSPDNAATKWLAKDFLPWYRAIIAVDMLCESAIVLQDLPPEFLKKQLELSTMTDLSQDFDQSQSKEYLYELYVGAILRRSGFTIEFAEPDLKISGHGLSQTLGVACKYLSSEDKINRNISKGYEQIEGQGLRGFVAIGMDNIVCAGLKRFIQFPEKPEHIMATMAGTLGEWVRHLIKARAGVQGRKPLDGAMFTLRMVGIWGSPLA